jgi:hypothetical protein
VDARGGGEDEEAAADGKEEEEVEARGEGARSALPDKAGSSKDFAEVELEELTERDSEVCGGGGACGATGREAASFEGSPAIKSATYSSCSRACSSSTMDRLAGVADEDTEETEESWAGEASWGLLVRRGISGAW